MTLSRKHFRAIADILGESDSIEEIVDRMCEYLATQNPRFVERRFRDAVNGGPLPEE